MENQGRQNSNSGNIFAFPIIPLHGGVGHPLNLEFEFGNTTTRLASPNSPADELFSNGKLLPHSFPVFHTSGYESPIAGIYARSSSRTSSVSSKDSMMSSRSNSTSSSRSSSTSVSARSSLSSSDSAEIRRNLRKDHQKKLMMMRNDLGLLYNQKSMNNSNVNYTSSNRGSQSQRWQFIAPMPALGRQGSVRRKEEVAAATTAATANKKEGIGRRIVKSLVSACKECHAIP